MHTRSDVTVSFLLCTLHRESDFHRCVAAIRNANTHQISYEVVVVDQGQSPAVAQTCIDCNFLYLSSETRGLSRARNIGLKHCKGEFVALMDDDAYISDSYFDVLQALLDKVDSDRLGAFSGRIMTIEDPSKPLSRYQGASEQVVKIKNIDIVLSSALIIRRSMFADIGVFDERLGVGAPWGGSEETDLLVRILRITSFVAYFPSLVVYHPMTDFSAMRYRDVFYKAYSYGKGRGALLRKHRGTPDLNLTTALVKPAGALVLSILFIRPKDVVRYCASALGRLYGYVTFQSQSQRNAI